MKTKISLFLILGLVGLLAYASPMLAHMGETHEENVSEDIVHEDVKEDINSRQAPVGAVYVDEAESLANDIALVSEQLELSERDVKQAIAFQKRFTQFADQLLERYPDKIAGVWVEPVPNMQGHIRLVGDAPTQISRQLQRHPDRSHISISGGALMSMSDNMERAKLTTATLAKMGYQNHVTFYDVTSDVIRAEVKISEGHVPPTERDIVRSFRALNRSATSITESDVKLDIIIGDEPIVVPQHSRGGNWLLDDGVAECTSGWSVSGPNGDGIITAAHCSGLNQFLQPGITAYPMTYRNAVYDTRGDVEYHTTDHIELGEFYANATTIRDVTHRRYTNSMVGQSVCVYGRSSNNRSCAHSVEAVGVTVLNGSVSIGNLARTNNATTIGGDSGGGWSYGTTAWGVHHGIGGGKSYFTPIMDAENALNVSVKG